jgi:hypothetical protein
MQIPPGSVKASSRAATFTPSPKMSSPSTIISPRLTPMRNPMRRSSGTSVSRSIIPRCTSTALHLHCAAHGIHHARKLRQQAVAGVLHDAAPVLPDLRIDQFPEVRLQPFVRPLLIRPHQARVAGHIGGEDRGEAADRGHRLSGGRLAQPSLPRKPAPTLVFRGPGRPKRGFGGLLCQCHQSGRVISPMEENRRGAEGLARYMPPPPPPPLSCMLPLFSGE